MKTNNSKFVTDYFYISGLHCASCQLIIEKTLIKIPEVQTVDVDLKKGRLMIEHLAAYNISAKMLNDIFASDGYRFSPKPFTKKSHNISQCESDCITAPNQSNISKSIFLAVIFVIAFIMLNKTGFSSLVTVNSSSSLPVFFLFGLLAGVSSCAALTGGIVLSMSKQWLSSFSSSDSFLQKAEPHFLFNVGRLISYALFGGLLGLIGNYFQLSPTFSSLLVIAISVIMVILGLQMLGVKAVSNFRLALPRSLTSRFADESNFQSRYAPILMGASTFFLPCGFTVTAQALALASGNPFQGSLIMALFALGTLPGLLAIGLSSVKFYSNKKVSAQFSTVAAMLILFFAAFNVNSQLSVLGLPNIDDIFASSSVSTSSTAAGQLPPMVNGKQVVKITASSFEYSPRKIVMRANTPTRWEVTANGISGCTNAIISKSLFSGQIDLVDGQTAVKEFTSPKPGVYKYSCWMGMVSGVVEVVDESGKLPVGESGLPAEAGAEAGAKGCGCGGGSGSCGGSR